MKPQKVDVIDRLGTPTAYLRYKGVWDMEDLYQSMADWFRRRKYKFYEKVYKHKHPSPFGIERQYIWQAQRKESEYMNYVIDVYWHTYDTHDIEVVMPDGEKKTFTKGRLWMEIKGFIQYDWEKRWNENVFYAELKNFLNNYILKKKWEQLWFHELWTRDIHGLISDIKERLK